MKIDGRRTIVILAAVAMIGLTLQATAKDIPLNLPRPDGKPGDAKKPVKVYILAGNQTWWAWATSVAPATYPTVYLSADPCRPSGALTSIWAAPWPLQSPSDWRVGRRGEGREATIYQGPQ